MKRNPRAIKKVKEMADAEWLLVIHTGLTVNASL
jgi:hypothetical protein